MQKITVLCVGKLKERFYQEAAAEYVKRLGRHCKLDVVELPESRLPEDPSPGQLFPYGGGGRRPTGKAAPAAGPPGGGPPAAPPPPAYSGAPSA